MINHSLGIRHQDGVTMDIPAVTGARACERRSVQRALTGFSCSRTRPASTRSSIIPSCSGVQDESAVHLTDLNSSRVSGVWIIIACDQVTEYRNCLLEILARAKYARTEEERARHFRSAEELSARARDTEKRELEGGFLAQDGL